MNRKLSNRQHAIIGSIAKRFRERQKDYGMERLSYMQTCIAIESAYQDAPIDLPRLLVEDCPVCVARVVNNGKRLAVSQDLRRSASGKRVPALHDGVFIS